MAGSAGDRNLLFGVLALQLDFINRDQLVQAVSAWILDKSRLLSDVLREQQALREDEHELLGALVQKHLERHDNDPAKSLAAVSSLGAVREDLEQLADADVQHSLTVVSRDRPASDPDATETFSVGASTSEGRRFRILRPHAEDGPGPRPALHAAVD